MAKLDKAKLNKAKSLVGKRLPGAFRSGVDLTPEEVREAREYIAEYWTKVERFHPDDDESLLGLPKPYLVPSYTVKTGFDYNELYYWDSYFMVQGLLDEDHRELVEGVLENLTTLFKRFKVIPNASRTYLTGRSQPPLLTSFIFDIYESYKKDDGWLKEQMEVAKQEYATVWMGTKKPNERNVYKGLSRYYDINYLHDLAEAESGWDMTPRFERRALNFLPVDLNSLLYKYEMDFARAARHNWRKTRCRVLGGCRQPAQTGHGGTNVGPGAQPVLRLQLHQEKTWRHQSSLAAYFPMWAGIVSDKQAATMVRSLRRFEQKGGLATTDALPLGQFMLGSMPTQWAYPNGWAPLHFIVVKGLERYGYHQDARRIAMKWLKTNLQWYTANHTFLEKYNVVSPEKPPLKGLYPSQTGFGWSNSVFERFCRDYIDRQE